MNRDESGIGKPQVCQIRKEWGKSHEGKQQKQGALGRSGWILSAKAEAMSGTQERYVRRGDDRQRSERFGAGEAIAARHHIDGHPAGGARWILGTGTAAQGGDRLHLHPDLRD